MTAYHGGKSRGGKEIAAIIHEISSIVEYKKDILFNTYWEPFCGMCGVYKHIVDLYEGSNLDYLASDIHESLIKMWNALEGGWKPPRIVTREKYKKTENIKGASAEKAYIGFGYSFGGKYFGGYKEYPEYKKRYNNILSLGKKFKESGVSFVNFSYNDLPMELIEDGGWIIYCDPPYGGDSINSYFKLDDISDKTDKLNKSNESNNPNKSNKIDEKSKDDCNERGKFDNDKFWKWARRIGKRGNLLFISDYVAPDDFISIYSREIRTTGKKNCDTITIEHLFIHKDIYKIII